MRDARAALVIGLVTLAGCQTYRPAPVKPEAFPAAIAERRLYERPQGETWTAAELLSAALARNPQVAEAAAKHQTALAAARAARVPPAATLILTAEYSNEADHWLVGAGSDVPLDHGARRSERMNAADLAARQALYDYEDAVWKVRTALAKACVALRRSEVETAQALELEAVRRRRAELLDRRVAAGEDARPTALLAHSDLTAASRRRADAQSRRADARIALAEALGVSPPAVDPLHLPSSDASSHATTQVDRTDAILGRSDVLRAIIDYDIAEGALRTEIARQYPEVHLGPGYTYDHGVRKIPFNLTLILPPADLNRAAISQAEAKRAEAGRSLEAVQASVLAMLDRAEAALGQTSHQFQLLRDRDRPAALAAEAAAKRARAAGEADETELLAARAATLESDLALDDAMQAADIAVVEFEDALRRPFDPSERDVLQQAVKRLGDSR